MSEFIGPDDLFASRERRRTEFTFPDTFPDLSGKKILLQAPTNTERQKWEQSMANPKTGESEAKRIKGARERLIVLCAIDKAGNRMFGMDDIARMRSIDSAIVVMLFNAAVSLMSADDEDTEDLVGNLPATADDSPT